MAQSAIRPLRDLRRRDLEAWAELASDAVEPNPFYEPDFVVPAAKMLGDAHLAVLAVWDVDEMIACLPVTTGRWRGLLPALAGWRHIYSFLGTPLVRKDRLDSALIGLLGAAGSNGGGGALFVIERASADGAVMSALVRAVEAQGLRCLLEVRDQRALLRRREDGDYLASIRSHHRRDLARLSRRLAERLGGEIAITDRAGDEAAVDSFLGLELGSWKGRQGTAMASKSAHGEFFKEVCRRFAASGRLELFELGANGQAAAMKCNLRAGEGSFAFKIAHDGELDRYSPGVQLELANIASFHSSGAAWMDSCAERDNVMINRLWPERRRLRSLVVGNRGVISGATGIGLRLADRALRAGRGG